MLARTLDRSVVGAELGARIAPRPMIEARDREACGGCGWTSDSHRGRARRWLSSTVCAPCWPVIGLSRLSKLEPTRAAEPVLPAPSRRTDPCRCEEAGPLRPARSSRHRPRTRQLAATTARAGKPSTSASMTPPVLAYVESACRRDRGDIDRVSRHAPWPGSPQRGVTHRTGHDRQRRSLQAHTPGRRWCADHDIRHLRTRPYRPRTNGKAERFIQTMLREWAYAATYQSSHQRALALAPWLDYYNRRRPHSALGHKAPADRLRSA